MGFFDKNWAEHLVESALKGYAPEHQPKEIEMANKSKAQKEAEAAAAAAAKNDAAEDADLTKPAADVAPKDEAKKLEKSKAMAYVGDKVFFHRDSNSGNGVVLQAQLAFLARPAAKESNLPPLSFDISVLTPMLEPRFGIMYSEEPKGGYWSFKSAK